MESTSPRMISRLCSSGIRRLRPAMKLPLHRRASSCRISRESPASSIWPMREAIVKLGGDPQKVNPLAPAELVIDHSVQVDEYGAANSLQHNNEIEFQR